MTANGTLSVDDVLKKIEFPTELRQLQTAAGDKVDRFAVWRPDINKPIGIVSGRYGSLPYADGFRAAVTAFMDSFPNEGYNIRRAELPRDGGRIYIPFEINREYSIAGNDNVKPMFILTNSYDCSTPFGFILGAFRLVCSNGLRAGVTTVNIRQKHYKSITPDKVRDIIREGINHFANVTVLKWREMAAAPIEKFPSLRPDLDEMMPERINEKVWEKVKAGESLWDLYNHYTAFFTHEYKKSYERSLELDGRVSKRLMEVV